MFDPSAEAVPTRYGGIRFRSRLEARWACFFDALKQPYEYEPSTYEVEPDLLYLPDFWLPVPQAWIEIKPASFWPDDITQRKVTGLFRVTNNRVAIFSEFPAVMMFADKRDPDGHVTEICNFAVHVVDGNAPGRCRRPGGYTLSELVLGILGLLDDADDPGTRRLYTARLVLAAEKSREYFGHLPHVLPDTW
jgi:hypothetical protein